MGKSTISMGMFNNELLNYQRVCILFQSSATSYVGSSIETHQIPLTLAFTLLGPRKDSHGRVPADYFNGHVH